MISLTQVDLDNVPGISFSFEVHCFGFFFSGCDKRIDWKKWTRQRMRRVLKECANFGCRKGLRVSPSFVHPDLLQGPLNLKIIFGLLMPAWSGFCRSNLEEAHSNYFNRSIVAFFSVVNLFKRWVWLPFKLTASSWHVNGKSGNSSFPNAVSFDSHKMWFGRFSYFVSSFCMLSNDIQSEHLNALIQPHDK